MKRPSGTGMVVEVVRAEKSVKVELKTTLFNDNLCLALSGPRTGSCRAAEKSLTKIIKEKKCKTFRMSSSNMT